jgi:F420 biosynthesis protein FbiB-like protein
MSIKNVLKHRRSIRKYVNQPVSDGLVFEVLEAARWAPSAHNAQPWRFVIVSDVVVKQCLAKAMAEAWKEDSIKSNTEVKQEHIDVSVSRFNTAPVFIVACLTFEDMKQYPDEEQMLLERDLAVQSLGAAVQNMLLSASEQRLGACWFSAPMFCKEVVRQVLGIPGKVEPQAIILMGYPDEEPKKVKRKTVEDFCFQNAWANKVSF